MCVLCQLGCYIRILLVIELHGGDLLLQALEDYEQGGHHEDLEQRTDEHTAHGCSTQSLVTVLTHTRSKHHWQQTYDHGEGGHEDRTQTGGSTQHSRP